jgi:asparagine synthase (glutamine-hydrolysing)
VCGIAGLLAPPAGGVDEAALAAMSGALVHRGPDDSGTFVDGRCGLAARRLSIIDIAGGHQPVSTPDGAITVVQNGEIYDHDAHRSDLRSRGYQFASRSDTEVIAHLYAEHGLDFAERLRGMFAIALWDAPRRRLVLARDRFGIKPLYWSAEEGAVAFASELRALQLRPRASTEIDLDAVEAFLAFNSIPAPLTIFRAARKLLPGHLLVIEPEGQQLLRFARPAPVAATAVRAERFPELAQEARDRLRDSVRAHLVADVPVGVLLSGGIDSSLLTALAAQESAERISTFSIGFKERSFDELQMARSVARRYGTDHHELVLEPDAAEMLPVIASAFDEPFGDSSALPTFMVSRLASEHVKVVLSGEGGDELFGGYDTYVADQLAPRIGRYARMVEPVVRQLPSSSERVSLDYRLKRFARAAHLPPLEAHHGWKEIFSPEERAELLRRGGAADPVDLLRARHDETAGADRLARLQDVDLGIYLVDDLLVKTDRMSMAHSLEARVPFLDARVAELALALPVHARVRGLAKKRLLRAAAEPLIGREIARGRKRGFSIPAAAWLRGPLEPFARDILSPSSIAHQGLLEPSAVTHVLDAHVAGAQDNSRQLWGLMTLTLWAAATRFSLPS